MIDRFLTIFTNLPLSHHSAIVPVRKRSITAQRAPKESDDTSMISLDLITVTDENDDGSVTGLQSMTPSVRSSIASRSKEALQRHQVGERTTSRTCQRVINGLFFIYLFLNYKFFLDR